RGRGSRIDREDRAGEIVRANQAEAVLDELTVAPFAVPQRVGRLLPRGGKALESRRGTLAECAALLFRHGLCRFRIITDAPPRSRRCWDKRCNTPGVGIFI